MNISKLIRKEFKNIFHSILNNGKVELTVDDLMDSPNSYIIEELNFLKGMAGIDEDERKSLLDFIILLEDVEEPVDYDEKINQRLISYIRKYPGIKSFKVFQIMFRMNHYSDGGLDIDGITDYYQEIFENHAEIVNLDDFFQKCNFLLPILLLEKPPKELVPVFMYGIERFPDKALLRFTLGRIYETNHNYDRALEYALQFLGQIESDRIYNESNNTYELMGDSITSEYYHITLLNISTLFYKKNEFKNAFEYSIRCLHEFEVNSEDIYCFQVLFAEPMLIKLRVHIQMDNKVGFIEDYKILRGKIDDFDFDEMDIDDIKEFAKGLKM